MAQSVLAQTYFEQLQNAQRRIFELEGALATSEEKLKASATKTKLDNAQRTAEQAQSEILELQQKHALEKADLEERLKAVSQASCSRAEQREIFKRKVLELDGQLVELTARCEAQQKENETLKLTLGTEKEKWAEFERNLQARIRRTEAHNAERFDRPSPPTKREGETLAQVAPPAKWIAYTPAGHSAIFASSQKVTAHGSASALTAGDRAAIQKSTHSVYTVPELRLRPAPGAFFSVPFSGGTFSFLAIRVPGQYIGKDKLPADLLQDIQKLNGLWQSLPLAQNRDWRRELENTSPIHLPICVSCSICGQGSTWRDGIPGRYACKLCVSQGLPCLTWTGEWYQLLPLAPEDRQHPKGVCATWLAGK